MARGEASTSAEQSEAREDDFGRSSTFRVASPLVMATRGSCVRFSPLRSASRSYLRLQPLPPASQGGSATRTNNRRPRRLLRLRCAPPSAMYAKASKLRSRLRAIWIWRSPLRRLPLAWITPKRASCEAGCERPDTSGHLKRSFSSPPVASAQTASDQITSRTSSTQRLRAACGNSRRRQSSPQGTPCPRDSGRGD